MKGSPTLVARLVGGLGNQLFIYAAARRLAIANDAVLELDVNFFRSDRLYGREYRMDRFAIEPCPLRRSATWLPPALDRRLWRVERLAGRLGLLPGMNAIVERAFNVFQPEVLTERLEGCTLFDGYWQDERYFADIRDRLERELRPVREPLGRNGELAAEMQSPGWIGIHCRRQHAVLANGAVVATRGRPELPGSYYRNALELLHAGEPIRCAVLFGDRPQWLLEHVPAGVRAIVVDWNGGPGGEVEDLWLMSRCRRLVVSNSTLSWWGAWLGRAHGCEVVAPCRQDLEYWVTAAAGWREVQW